MANTHSANFVRASTQYATRASVPAPNSQFTIEFWARLTDIPGVATRYNIIQKTGHFSGPLTYQIQFVGSSGGVVHLLAKVERTDGADSSNEWELTGVISAGEWNQYTVTFDLAEATATEKFLYMNGAPVAYGDVDIGSSVTASTWAAASGTLYLGYGSGAALNGDLDDVRIWNTIRSPTQVAYNWNRGLSAGDADFGDLFAYWRLDNDWLDASGSGYHLTPTNGPTFIDPAFVEAGDPSSRRSPHGMVPRPISDLDAVNREFARITLQEAGSALWNPNNWTTFDFRTGFALSEEVGVPGLIHIDNTGGALPGAHATTHEDGDTDEITAQNLGSGAAPAGKVLESDGAGGWTLIDTPEAGAGTAATGIYVLQASSAIPEGDATLDEITGGVAAHPGSAIALAVKVEDAVTVGTIDVTLKVAGSATLTVQLNTGVPSKRVATAAIGAHPITFENEISVVIETAGGYENAAGATTGMTINLTLINGEIGGSTQVSSTTVYGCPAGLDVNDAVYLSGADTVDLADADDAAKQPLIGFVRSKPTATSCEILYYGELSGFTGLSVGSNYFLSETPGQITTVAPTAPGSIVQKVGFPRNATTLVVFVDRDYVEN